jgi:sugar transferase (PEP-CTERM/EpsH1 system associated)
MKRPKMLFVSARPPYPLDTGAKIRSWHILSGLTQAYEVEVLTFRDPSIDNDWLREARHLGISRLEMVNNPGLNQEVSPSQFIKATLKGKPASVLKYCSDEFSSRFKQMTSNGHELVHFEHVHLVGEAFSLPTGGKWPLITLDAHNVECQIAARLHEGESFSPRKAALAIHAHNMRRFETRAFEMADLIMAVSPQDAAIISQMTKGQAKTTLVENGVDKNYFTPGDPEEVKPGSMVFVGSMDWLPNVDAMSWFATQVLPFIRRQRPDCSLTIVGRKPHPEVAALHDPDQGMVVTGTVDDVRPYLRQAEVVVTPLRFGGGTRLKILEAFAMEKAVVTTAMGCEGIAYKENEHLLVADDPEGLARACLQVMNNPANRRELGRRGREMVLDNYVWSSITARMLSALDNILGVPHV